MSKLIGFIITIFFLITMTAPLFAGTEAVVAGTEAVVVGTEAVVVGMYGVPSIKSVRPETYIAQFEKAGVNAVFVPDDEETIKWFKEKGYKVYISMNIFGGTETWKKYPDSRPVKENGELLEEGHGGYGGICPTHEGWRKERLDYIEGVLRQFGGKEGVDGIWLDFIRYPGMWEVAEPDVPDTCYCERCLSKFHEEMGTHNSQRATRNPQLFKYEWMLWKKKQVASFAIDVKRIIKRYSKERPIKLGLFIVPWTKGERENDISFKIAQDAFELSKHVDVISPMVYHKMCGQNELWVGKMTEYYKETASCEVWPIVQSHDCEPGEFTNVVRYAGEAGADGVFVLSFGGMKPDLWRGMRSFKKPVNLLSDISRKGNLFKSCSQFTIQSSRQAQNGITHDPSPMTHHPSLKTFDQYYMRDEFKGKPVDAIGITGSYDRKGSWEITLPKCKPGQEYLFTGLFYRDKFENGVYADVSMWGQKFHINEHLWAGTFQPIRVYVTCPDKVADRTFKFINNNPETTFYLAKAELRKVRDQRPEVRGKGPVRSQESGVRSHNSKNSMNSTNPSPFPIGTYGANLNNLEEIKKTGINTVIISGKGEELKKLIQECQRLGLKYILSIPHDPDELHVYLDDISREHHNYSITQSLNHQSAMSHLGFYVNDEPEIVSFPINKANDIQRLIKDRFPEAATFMAVVRPQKVRDYSLAGDFFMMDQYPVPSMPMVWLSDSMDEAAKHVGADRLVSVIQAFGGGEETKHGWPRLPTRQEMECLTFLSIVHGSKGIFFFTFSDIGKTETGRKDLAYVVERLNKLGSWLTVGNIKESEGSIQITQSLNHSITPGACPRKQESTFGQAHHPGVGVEILSPYGMDEKGRPAIHIALKNRGNKWLLMAVNTIGTNVEALIHTNINKVEIAKEIFSDIQYGVTGSTIHARFKPYEVKTFLIDEASDWKGKQLSN